MLYVLRLIVYATTTVFLIANTARGQETPMLSPSPTPLSSPAQAPSPIPLAEVVTRAESALGNLRDIETQLTSDQIPLTVDKELPLLTREIDARVEESTKILTTNPSLETLRDLEVSWQKLGE